MDWVIVFGVLRGLKGIQRLVRDMHSHTQVSVSAYGPTISTFLWLLFVTAPSAQYCYACLDGEC